MLLQRFPRAGDLAEMDFYSRCCYAQVLAWVDWVHFLLQVLPDPELQSVLVQQRMLTSQISLLKLVPRQVLENNVEQVHILELDSKGKFNILFWTVLQCFLCQRGAVEKAATMCTRVPYFVGPE